MKRKVNFYIIISLFSVVYILFLVGTKQRSNNIYEEKALIKESYQTEYSYFIKVLVKGKYYNFYYKENLDVGRKIIISGTYNSYNDEVIPNGFNANQYYLSNNVSGYLTNLKIDYTNSKSGLFYIEKIKLFFTKNQSRDTLKIINKIIFNQNSAEDDNYKNFKDLNVYHLINLSGIHIYLLLYLIKKLNYQFNINTKQQKVIEVIVLIVIYIFSAFKYIILRIIIYNLLKLLKGLYSLKVSNYSLMHISFLVLLILKPYLLINQGILISFLIVNAVTLLSPLYENNNFFIKSIIISFISTIILLPFNQNISIISIIFMPLFMILAIYIVFPLALLTLIFSQLGLYLVFIYNVLLVFINYTNKYLNGLNFSIGQLRNIVIIIYYLLIYLVVLNRLILKRVVYIILIIIVVLTPNIERYVLDEQMYFLDVGQGDSFVYISKNLVIVVDAYKNVGNFLKSKGIKKIDYLILSHSDSDHSLESSELINNFKIDNILLSKFDNYHLSHKNIKLIQAPYNIKIDYLELDFFGPLKKYNERNNNSLIFKLTTKKYTILFTGDILEAAENDIANTFGYKLKSDILKVAHHGSKSSSNQNILKYINPKYAIISYAKNNKYGFPHQETLLNINGYTKEIYHTASDYTVIIYQGKIYKFKSLTMKRRWFIV